MEAAKELGTRINEGERPGRFFLFEGDLVNRLFAKIHIGGKSPLDLILRILVLLGVTWAPMAVLAYFGPRPENAAADFFYDFAAYAQFFVGLPLYVIAERIVERGLLTAARNFASSGVIRSEDLPKLRKVEGDTARLRKERWPEIVCIAAAYIMSLSTIGSELFWPTNAMATWHVQKTGMTAAITPAGLYAMLVALPIQTYWWVRWVWKIALWYRYLREVSRFRLALVASHPDRTGGIGFLSEVQAKFAIVILAYGISNVAATVGYKIAVENAPVNLPPVWGMVLGFAILGPTLFLAPLLLFTKQLARTKRRTMNQFRDKAVAAAWRVEEQWLQSRCDNDQCDANARNELSQLNLLSGFYSKIHEMRVVPFDLRSAAQLFGSAITPLIPLLPQFFDLPEPWKSLLGILPKWLSH